MSSIINSLPENWEAELECRLLNELKDRAKKRVYICSPCQSNCTDGIGRNMRAARFYMYYALNTLNVIARAPHAYLPIIFNDHIPKERSLALQLGQQFLEQHEEMLVCGSTISHGMRNEIERAAELEMPIRVFDKGIYEESKMILRHMGAKDTLVSLDKDHIDLALSTNILYLEDIHEKVFSSCG